MPEQQIGAEPESKKDLHHLEVALQLLWEKARLVSDSLLRYKEENNQLKQRLAELEMAKAKVEADLDLRDQELQQVKATVAQLQTNGTNLFNKEDKETLQTRIKELIEKLNSRL